MSNFYCHPGKAGGFPNFWLRLAELATDVSDFSTVTTGKSTAGDVSIQSISGDEAAWCSVGILGADAVSGGTASFFYAAACVGAADLSEE